MHKITTTLFLAGAALAVAFGAQAQSAPGDMSRYESIYESPKAIRVHPTPHAVPQGIQPGKRVETIVPSPSLVMGRPGGLGMSESPQPVVRPSVPMTSGGTVTVAPGIVDKVAPQGASNADMPAPKKRTTEMITEDAKGQVIGRSTVVR